MGCSKACMQRGVDLARPVIKGLEFLAPGIDLYIRFYVAEVFWKSGLTKIDNWESTVALFENEFKVPLLSAEIAAYAGTATELIFPVLLLLGLGGRCSAFVLFVFNIIAVISYPELSEAGLKDHQFWGLLLLITLLHGPGKLSVDHFIRRKFMPQ